LLKYLEELYKNGKEVTMQNEDFKSQVEETINQDSQNDISIEEFQKVEIPLDSDNTQDDIGSETQVDDSVDDLITDSGDIDNLDRGDAVSLLVKKAKILVEEADNKLNEVQAKLKNDLQDYEEEKAKLKSIVVDVNSALLKQLDYQQEHLEELEALEEGIQYGDEMDALESIEESIEVVKNEDFFEAPAYEIKDTISPMYVEEPSSGKFGGFVMGLIGGGATFAGMAYFASTKLGIKLDPSQMPDMEKCKPIFEYYAKLIGQTDPNIGMGVMGASALLVLWIVYAIKKSSKATKNLAFVKEQLHNAESYAEQKQELIDELEKIDAHLNDAKETFKLYGVVLNEQKAKLNRIMFIEADKIADGSLHEKSLQEIEDTRNLVESFKEYLATPLADENGRLSIDITKKISTMKENVDNLIKRLY